MHYDLLPENRIGLADLVSLNNSRPTGSFEDIGDCAGVVLRVSELWDAASRWEAETSSTTLLSPRGGKKRERCSGREVDYSEFDSGKNLSGDAFAQVRRLAENPLLEKCIMPREDAVKNIMEKAKIFEWHMQKFLGQDFDDISGDRAPYPDSPCCSLIGKNDTFLIHRLTGSSLWVTLRSSVESIEVIARDCLLTDTPGKGAFEWIKRVFEWLDFLQNAVTKSSDRLVIPEMDARQLLEVGKVLFFDLNDDLNKTLSRHKIFLSIKKEEEKISVVFRKDAAHHSVGGAAIRWSTVFFEGLKEDIVRLDAWKIRLRDVQQEFELFFGKEGNITKGDEQNISRLHDFFEEVNIVAEEINSCVVVPRKSVLDGLKSLYGTLDKSLKALSCPSLDKIAKQKYEDSEALYHDRLSLLDSLTRRRIIAVEKDFGPDDNSGTKLDMLRKISRGRKDTTLEEIRESLRDDVMHALKCALESLDVDVVDSNDTTSVLCAVKAWEIEFSLYSRFQVPFSSSKVSQEYMDCVLKLPHHLQDVQNRVLCGQFLLGEIEAIDLVPVGLAHLPMNDVEIENGCKQESCEMKENTLDEREEVLRSPSSSNEEDPLPNAPPTSSPQASRLVAPSSTKREMKTVFMSKAGVDVFEFNIYHRASTPYTFMARFQLDDQACINGRLPIPATFTQQRSIERQPLLEFVKKKIRGETKAYTLRLDVSKEHAAILTQFQKDYEKQDRLAMFSIEGNSKMFLVTPKFHRRVAKVIDKLFPIESSTYAVVLTKERI